MFWVSPDADYEAAILSVSVLAAGYDLHSRRIPNVLTGVTFLLALALHAGLGGRGGVADSSIGAAIGFVITLLFFMAGGMGAGDVKLMAAVGALAGWHRIGTVLLTTALWAALCAVVVARRRGRLKEVLRNAFTLADHHRTQGLVPHPELHLRSANGLRIPFAVPIALGCLSEFILRTGRG